MRVRSTIATLLAAAWLTACSAGTPAATTTTAAPADQAGTPGAVLQQAHDVAADLEQREADLESMIP
jgi:hypothetical protein